MFLLTNDELFRATEQTAALIKDCSIAADRHNPLNDHLRKLLEERERRAACRVLEPTLLAGCSRRSRHGWVYGSFGSASGWKCDYCGVLKIQDYDPKPED